VAKLQKELEQVTAYNTELVIDIRMMKGKFRQLTEREKLHVAGRLLTEEMSNTVDSPKRGIEDFEQSEATPGNEDGLAAMEHFASVWSTHDDDLLDDDEITEPDETETPVPAASLRSGTLGSTGTESESAPGGIIASMTAGGAALLGGIVYARKNKNEEARQNEDRRPKQYTSTDAVGGTANLMANRQAKSGEFTAPSDERSFGSGIYYDDDPEGQEFANVSVFEDDYSKDYDADFNAVPPPESHRSSYQQRQWSDKKVPLNDVNGTRMVEVPNQRRVAPEINNQPRLGRMDSDSTKSFGDETGEPGDELYILNERIEADDLRALESEASVLADQFKLNSTFLESISDLQTSTDENKRNESELLHNLDISKITAGTGEDEDRNFAMPDSMFGSPFRSVNRSTESTEEMFDNSSSTGIGIAASAGESSGGAVPSAWKMLYNLEGQSLQHAGEPSGDRPSSSEGPMDFPDDDDDDDDHLKPPIPLQYKSPKREAVPRSPGPALRTSFTSTPPNIESPMNRSQNSQKNLSFSIADWSAVGMTGGLLADLSDSQSTSSYAESYTDSVSSMEATSRPSDLEVPLAKEIDQLVAHADFDAVKVAAENFGTVSYGYKGKERDKDDRDRLAKIKERKEKKRELEAWRISLSKSFEDAK